MVARRSFRGVGFGRSDPYRRSFAGDFRGRPRDGPCAPGHPLRLGSERPRLDWLDPESANRLQRGGDPPAGTAKTEGGEAVGGAPWVSAPSTPPPRKRP